MEFGAHLPQIVFPGATPLTVEGIARYVSTARELGFSAISANDHVVHRQPWHDGPTILTLALPHAEGMMLATTVGLPVVRGPATFAKTTAELDRLSDGRVVAGVSAGADADDYALAGIPWDERWKRLDDAVGLMRALWSGERHRGPFYSSDGVALRPPPARAGGPPVWIGSWGSDRGLRRVAELGDGWLASAYNTTPDRFAAGLSTLRGMLSERGRSLDLPNGLATMMFNVTDDPSAAEFLMRAVAASLGRDPAEIGERLMLGPSTLLAEKIARYEQAGLQRMFLWPFDLDPVGQLERFAHEVVPLLG